MKKKTQAQKRREAMHEKIIRIFLRNENKFDSRADLYIYVAKKAGVSYTTAIRVLKDAGLTIKIKNIQTL